jgi:Putative prokaryotic signal transducing protein
MTEGSGLVVVRAFSHPHEAHLACSALQAAGIHATLADDHIVAANWLYSNVVGGVKVLVPVEDAAAAQAVLAIPAEIDPGAVAEGGGAIPVIDATTCPRCGSYNVGPVTPGRRLLFLSWLMVGMPVLPVVRRTKCGDCGHRFRVPRETA